jgi:D-alanyl-D-alanine carboxypeptidase (penicillin-binding protein 5/6)
MNMRLISVVLGSTDVGARTAQTQQILDYGFRFFETIKISDISEQVPIFKSTKDTLKIGLSDSTYITLARGQFKLSQQAIALNSELSAPIVKGDTVGNLLLTYEGKTLAKLPLVALEDAEEAGFFSRTIDNIKMLF